MEVGTNKVTIKLNMVSVSRSVSQTHGMSCGHGRRRRPVCMEVSGNSPSLIICYDDSIKGGNSAWD